MPESEIDGVLREWWRWRRGWRMGHSSETQMKTAKLEMKMKCSSLEIWEEPSWNQSQNHPRQRPLIPRLWATPTTHQDRLREADAYHPAAAFEWVSDRAGKSRADAAQSTRWKKQKGKERIEEWFKLKRKNNNNVYCHLWNLAFLIYTQ